MYIVRNFLNEEEIKELLENLEGWEEGFTNSTKEHKDNYEIKDSKYATLIADKIKANRLATHRLFIKRMTLPRFNKYKKDQKYARHIDSFVQSGVQTDWSYTLILKKPEKGGELRIESENQNYTIGLNPGDIVFYHSGKIHEVTPIEEGERIAAIGWIESVITREDERAILHNMLDVLESLDYQPAQKDLVVKLSYSYHNLLRIWNK